MIGNWLLATSGWPLTSFRMKGLFTTFEFAIRWITTSRVVRSASRVMRSGLKHSWSEMSGPPHFFLL